MDAKLNEYYAQTAKEYDAMHVHEKDEHFTALVRAAPMLSAMSIQSVLDVGCGTGRALEWFAEKFPGIELMGIDPSAELLEIAKQKLPGATLKVASGEQLPFPDQSADVVVATAIMHHVDSPTACINEMFRVARKAVLISDHNNFAFGGALARRVRLGLFAAGLLPAFTFVKQGFRRQGYSKGDGWWYPYSLLTDFSLISKLARDITIFPTRRPNPETLRNMILCQSHLAILASK